MPHPAGTHPALIEALEPHEQKKKEKMAYLNFIRKREIANVDALYECEKKQAEDETRVRCPPTHLSARHGCSLPL
jgi:hypothetical protein